MLQGWNYKHKKKGDEFLHNNMKKEEGYLNIPCYILVILHQKQK